jgi:hypothetical protein
MSIHETASPSETLAENEKHNAEDVALGPTPAYKPEREAPDGGAAAWLVVLGAWCTSFCSFGWINSQGIFTLSERSRC